MSWAIDDVDSKKKGLTSPQKKKWVKIANITFRGCMKDVGDPKKCEPMAIKIANEKCTQTKRI